MGFHTICDCLHVCTLVTAMVLWNVIMIAVFDRIASCDVVSGVTYCQAPRSHEVGQREVLPNVTLSWTEWFCIQLGRSASHFHVSWTVGDKATSHKRALKLQLLEMKGSRIKIGSLCWPSESGCLTASGMGTGWVSLVFRGSVSDLLGFDRVAISLLRC